MGSKGSGGSGQGRCTWCSVEEQGISLEDWIWRGGVHNKGPQFTSWFPGLLTW